ncbi:hypothetical protein COCVIDRAFT_106765 [Bipolaris victoriae FI3]|uniref:PHD-type domain-containing protein n=1 Tax=Bipolaris victoriae (strain FI3) TaxID=930091 RepID=W7EB16_BIPV3|nr:hypothetical protein COCVIDRAFT_106765 [Bipolaris victoriae FI3]
MTALAAMSSIDSLLNHDARPDRRPSLAHCADMTTTSTSTSTSPSQTQTPNTMTTTTSTDDATDALTTLATLGNGQQYPPAHTEPAALQDQVHDATSTAAMPSPQPSIKHEPSGTPRENTPAAGPAHPDRQASVPGEDVDSDALKALEIAKQSDLGLRRRNQMGADGLQSPVEPKPAPASAKKRPAPASAVRKKGTAKTSKPNKKRKVETDDGATRSVTPTARVPKPPPRGFKRSSHAGTPLESSPAPDNSSQAHGSDDDGESSEDHNLYCLCKKPDNHRWMIGCDGGCDDWFHGDCVNMKQADEELVDRFICPLCEENGRGHTTWKPMCRRDGCRKPARLTKGKESKYCSDDCGLLFMSEQLQRTAGAKGANGSREKQKKKKKTTDGEPIDEEEPTPLGGTLRAKDLKALVDASPNIQAFKNLGTGVLTPPQTASPSRSNFPSNGEDLALTAAETDRLAALHKEKVQLKDRLEVLKDREKFVSMAKEQAVRLADREKIKIKDFCGYDSRLSWSDAEFLLWRNSKHGRAVFQYSTLSPTDEQVSSIPDANGVDTMDIEIKETACLKKRCQKHPQWQKLNLQDARFEELEVVEAIKECEKDEQSVRERARRRGAKDGLAKELAGGDMSKVARNREGWVETVKT